MSAITLKFPEPQPCHACGCKFARAVCPLCKEERPLYTALKKQTARERGVQPIKELPACLHNPKALCDCGLMGNCLPDAA